MLSAQSQLTLLAQHAAEGQDLSPAEIEQAIHHLLEPEVSLETKAELLLCLRRKGETPQEIADFATLIRNRAVDPHIDINRLSGNLLDTCGTGGDGSNTFNVSTAVAFVLAATEIPVAKHGNRSISSKCGSADVLEALGIKIEMTPARLRESVETLRIGFLFAPQYHETFKQVRPVREFLARKGERTIFNLLGPLVNPARPNIQIVGVYDPALTDLYVQVLQLMKLKRALVVHGYGPNKTPGLDELSTMGLTKISQLHSNGKIETIEINFASFNLRPATLEELRGGGPAENADIIRNLLSGKDKSARLDFLLLNASVGFVLAGVAKNMEEGIKRGLEIIDSGAAQKKLEAYRAFSQG